MPGISTTCPEPATPVHFHRGFIRPGLPMRRDCANLTEARVPSGHWMAQERPIAVNAALARWLAARFPELWAGTQSHSRVEK